MKLLPYKLFTSLLLGLLAFNTHSETLSIMGVALDASDQQIEKYRSFFYLNREGQITAVKYKDSSGKIFAEKQLSYPFSDAAPAVNYQDQRSGHQYAVAYQGDKLLMQYRQNFNDGINKKAVTIEQPLVVDAGFDAYIKANWQSLLAGEKHEIHYAFVARQQLIDLLVEQVDARQCGSNGEQLCFRVYVKNFFIRMLADDLFLSYSNNKELLQFKGVSNVVDADGSAIKTQVQYSFSPKLNEVEYYSQEVFAF